MFKRIKRKLNEAKSGDSIVLKKHSVYFMQARVIVLVLLAVFLGFKAHAGFFPVTDEHEAQAEYERTCRLPMKEGELTLALRFRGERLCWVMF